jgi:hypothetical protein
MNIVQSIKTAQTIWTFINFTAQTVHIKHEHLAQRLPRRQTMMPTFKNTRNIPWFCSDLCSFIGARLLRNFASAPRAAGIWINNKYVRVRNVMGPLISRETCGRTVGVAHSQNCLQFQLIQCLSIAQFSIIFKVYSSHKNFLFVTKPEVTLASEQKTELIQNSTHKISPSKTKCICVI